MKSITNAAPGLVNPGMKDESDQPYTRTPESYPQHLPKTFLFAGKGPCTLDPDPEQLLAGNEANIMYGEEPFVEQSKYFTHQTKFRNSMNAEGNAQIHVRLAPPDIGPKATIRLFMDVLATDVDDYERNTDGSIKTNLAGDPIVLDTVAGHRVKIVAEYAATHLAAEDFGLLTQRVGTQTGTAGAVSTAYPIAEWEVSFYGEPGNLAGIRLWPQNSVNSALPTKMINKERAYPFNLAVITKNVDTGSSIPSSTIFNEQYTMVTFKPGVKDPLTGKRLSIDDIAITTWREVEDTRYPKTFGEFGRFHLYQQNLETLLRQFQLAEAPFLDVDSDFDDSAADMWMFNFLTGRDLNNVPYHSYVFVNSVDSVRFSSTTGVYARGGSDGTMTNATFAAAVSEYMQRYADENDELQDVAYHTESIVYDSGYPLATKYDLLKIIAERKDTLCALSVFEFGERHLTSAEEYSVAESLRLRANQYPESIQHGTPVYRVLIQGCSGKIRLSTYKKEHFPVLHEIAVKSARYMGASDGRFKAGESFEGYPGHIIDTMYDISIPFTPDGVKVRNWDVGLNWVARDDRKNFYIPAMKSIYGEDTSVATGWINASILAYINKVIAKAQRRFGSRSDLTPAQLTQEVNNFIVQECLGCFDNRAIVTPQAHFTSLDQARNYSWTVPVICELNGMRTVMTGYVVARRRASDNG